jgi:PAS domain S-box-containing protein
MISSLSKEISELGFERVRLYLLSDDNEHLVAVAQHGMEENFVGSEWSLSDKLVSRLSERSAVRLFSNGNHEEVTIEHPLKGNHAIEWAGIGLWQSHQLRGLIAADNKSSERLITEAMLARLSEFTVQVMNLIPEGEELRNSKPHHSSQTSAADHAETIVSKLEQRPLFKIIIQSAVQLLKAESGGVYEYDPQRGELLLVAEHNRPQHIGYTLKVGEGMAGRLVLDDKVLNEMDSTVGVLEDGTAYRAVDNYNEWEGRASCYKDGSFGAVLNVQLRWHDQIIGVLYVDALKGRVFTREDAHLLKRFADDAAIALVQVKKLARLSHVMKELMGDLGKTSLDERLNQIAMYAAEMVDAEVCGVFLVKRPGKLSLEASFGHREDAFQKGKEYDIRTGTGTGLTGHIAFEGKVYTASGDELNRHPAVRGVEPDCSPSFVCTSLLAIPLKSKSHGPEQLVGLIRVSNKLNRDRKSLPPSRFSEEDEWILTIFAETVVTAIEGAVLINELIQKTHKLSGMVLSSPCGIIGADRYGNITQFTEKARTILGYAPDDPGPTQVTEVYLSEADARGVGAELHRNKGKIEKFRIETRGKDGQHVPLLLSATWLYDGKGERSGSVGYFEDLRPVIAAEKRLALYLEANSIVATADSPSEGLQNLAEKLISLLKNSFCRILLLDENRQYLTVAAAYPIKRSGAGFQWTHGRNQRVALVDYEGLDKFLETGEPRVIKWTDDTCRQVLEKFSKRIGLQQPVQSLLIVPLRLGKTVVGLLDIGELREEPDRSVPHVAGVNNERREDPLGHIFDDDKIEMVKGVAGQTSSLIERIKLFEIAERKRKLLERLDEKARELQSAKDLEKLRRDVIIYAMDLIEGRDSMAGVLFTNYGLHQKLEPVHAIGLELSGIERLSHSDGVIGRTAKTGKSIVVPHGLEYAECDSVFSTSEFHSMVAIPLFHGGELTYVLALADRSPWLTFGDAELETLERFGAQAAIALQAAQLMSPERKTFHHLKVLHQVTEAILRQQDLDKVLHSFLTGITAGYGLGFNRAAVLLLNEAGEILEGAEGIGQVDQKQAEEDWANYHAKKLDTFQSYQEHLNNRETFSTPIGNWVRHYALNIEENKSSIFKDAVRENEWSLIPYSRLQTDLPRDFLYGFRPTTDVVIIPLHTREKAVGVLIADNKFTKALITSEDVESLLTYGNMTALAIDNLRLLQRIETNRQKMQNLFKAGTTLRTTSDPARMLSNILELTQESAEASWVRIILIDELGKPHKLISKGTDFDPPLDQVFLPDGIGQKVLLSGEVITIENTHRTQEPLNPLLLGNEPQALVCLPLSMQGRAFGVIWVGYSSPRVFHDTFLKSLQLYVNQAAIAYDSARRMEELEQMRHAVEALAATDKPKEVLDNILKRTTTALRADSAAIWTYDDVQDIFLPNGWVSYNIPSELKEAFWKKRPRYGGTAFTAMKEDLIDVKNVQDSSYQYLGNATRRLLRQIRVQAFLGISLSVGDERLGVLYINYKRPRNFSEEEKETARTFANHAAMALMRAKLFEQLQTTKRAAEAVAAVTVIGDHEQTLDEIVKDTTVALNCDAVTLFVYDKSIDTLRHPPHIHGLLYPEKARADRKVDRESIVYKILDREQPEFIPNAETAPLTRDRRFRQDEGIKSVVGIPLKAGGEKVGVMFVNYHTQRYFTKEEQENVGFFANLAAAAISNALLFEKRLQEQTDHLELSRQLLATETEIDRMQVGVKIAAKMLHAEFCAIILPEEDNNELVFVAAHGWDQKILDKVRLKTAHGSQTGYTIERREPVIVRDFREETRFEIHDVIKDMDLRSSVSVPMFEGAKIIGVILIHSRQVDHFTSYDVGLLTLIANQLSVAMQSARVVNRKQRSLDALYQASKAIAGSLDPERVLDDYKSVLDEIIKQAVAGGIIQRNATLGMIKRYDETSGELVCESLYAPGLEEALLDKIREQETLTLENGGKMIGVVGLAITTRQTQLIPDVSKCENYVEFEPTTRSELVTPLIIDGKVRGVINLESDRVNGFDEHDKQNLEALRELVVVVLRNAEVFKELIETKGIVESNKALARMGMIHGVWGHAIEGHAINIKNLPTLMRAEIKDWKLSPEQNAQLEERLSRIESMSEKILRRDTYPPLVYAENLEVWSLHDLINDRVTQLWKSEPYSKVTKDLTLQAKNSKVRVTALWFRHALDILIDNAVKAMVGRVEKKISIATSQKKNEVQISVSDTGRGIPEEKRPGLLKHPLPVGDGESGFGVGLLFARMIIETYNGTLELEETGDHGTTFVITLPTAE